MLHIVRQSDKLVFILEPKEACLFYESRLFLFLYFEAGSLLIIFLHCALWGDIFAHLHYC